jgi:hypothetical protein
LEFNPIYWKPRNGFWHGDGFIIAVVFICFYLLFKEKELIQIEGDSKMAARGRKQKATLL